MIINMSETYLERFLEWGKQPKNYRWVIPLLVFLILFFVLKGFFARDKNSNGDYVIARDERWYPLNFYGKEKSISAFADELILQIAQRKGLKVQIISESSGNLLESLDHQADGILSALSPDIVLQDKYLFSDRFYDLGAVLVVDTRSKFTSLKDLEGKFLGVMRGSNVLFNIPGHANVRVAPYDSVTAMLEDVVKDKIDGALVNQLNAYNFTKGYYKGKLVVATPPLTQEGLRLITRMTRRDAKLISAFNEGLAEMLADKSYHALLTKWELHDPNQ